MSLHVAELEYLQADGLKRLETDVCKFLKSDVLKCLQTFALKCLLMVCTQMLEDKYIYQFEQKDICLQTAEIKFLHTDIAR